MHVDRKTPQALVQTWVNRNDSLCKCPTHSKLVPAHLDSDGPLGAFFFCARARSGVSFGGKILGSSKQWVASLGVSQWTAVS